MKLKVYTVFDVAAEVFCQPILVINEKIIFRIMRNCMLNPEHNYALNPEDYVLYEMGEFDDTSGIIDGELKKITSLLAIKPNTPE